MAGKPNFGPGFEFNATMCAILYPLSLRPMYERELHRLLMCPRNSLQRNIRKLLSMGIVTRRADKKLQMIVGLMLPKMPKVGAPVFLPSNVPVLTPDKIQRPDPEEGVQAALNFKPEPEDPPLPRDWSGTGTPASDRAKMLSEKLRVPAKLRGKGEVSLGPLAKCGCGIATPMRYGGKALCPVCARR